MAWHEICRVCGEEERMGEERMAGNRMGQYSTASHVKV